MYSIRLVQCNLLGYTYVMSLQPLLIQLATIIHFAVYTETVILTLKLYLLPQVEACVTQRVPTLASAVVNIDTLKVSVHTDVCMYISMSRFAFDDL